MKTAIVAWTRAATLDDSRFEFPDLCPELTAGHKVNATRYVVIGCETQPIDISRIRSMPRIIQTPEGWFREKQRDLYLVKYRLDTADALQSDRAYKALEKRYRRDRECLHRWFSENLPDTTLTVVGPSEYSGYLFGGPGFLAADFDEPSLAVFHSTWSDPDSVWQVEHLSHVDWLSRVRSARLLPVPLPVTQKVRWWDTPAGIILLSAANDGTLLSRLDAWSVLPQLVPMLSHAYIDQYPYGEFLPASENYDDCIAIDWGDLEHGAWDGDAYAENIGRIRQLRKALNIPGNIQATIAVGY